MEKETQMEICEDLCADCGRIIFYCELCMDYYHINDDDRCFLIQRGHSYEEHEERVRCTTD